MKNIFFTTMVCICLSLTVMACEKQTPIAENELSNEMKVYVEKHFPLDKISFSIKDQDGVSITYDITLKSGIKLEFNNNKEIIEIDGNDKKLPDSVIPEKILSYIKTSFPDAFVTSWELDGKFQKVELNNSLDLVFDLNGNFKEIDD